MRDPTLAEVSASVEPHVLAAALVLVAAAACDALTLLDPPAGGSLAPSSLRVSSIVALLVFAAPRIAYVDRKDGGKVKGFALADQRVALALPLCAFALSGLHYGTESTRLGDALYTTFVLLVAVHVCAAGGIENEAVRPDDITTSPHRRQTVSGLCAALFVYVGLRGVRSAYVAADEVPEHTVQYSVAGQTHVVPGHAQISLARVVPVAFGHGTLVCTGMLVGTSGQTHLTGSSTVAFEVGMAGVAATVAALWATIARAETIDDVPALYCAFACSGAREACVEAYQARRFATANASAASLWLGALGAMLYAVATERRIESRGLTRAEQLFQQQGFGSGTLLLVAAGAALYVYGSQEGAQWYVDVCVGVVLLGTFVSTFAEVAFGALMSTGAFGALLSLLQADHGTVHLLQQGDGTLLLLSLACMAAYTLLDLVGLLVRLCGNELVPDRALLRLTAATGVAGTSLSFVLFVASALALAGARGAAPFVYDSSGSRTMLVYVALHYLPLFAWMPMYACRCGVQSASTSLRVTAWHVSFGVAVIVHGLLLPAVPLDWPNVEGVEIQSTALASAAGLIGWYVTAYV